jgi:hypothetical protein
MSSPPTITSIAEYLSRNANRYFADLNGQKAEVKLEQSLDLYSATIHTFSVRTRKLLRAIVVKVPVGRKAAKRFAEIDVNSPCPEDRPRVRPLPDPNVKFKNEYAALCAIHDHFRELRDPRFGTIRVLDILPDNGAIVMEHVGNPKLSSLLFKVNRLQRPFMSFDIEKAFRNAGAWLRAFHRLPKLDHSSERHTRRTDYVKSIQELADFLVHVKGMRIFFEQVAHKIEAASNAMLPENLPIGMGHGDYAPHNIFVGADGRVTVFDTLAKWHAPVYEDIGHFLTLLKTNKLQTYSQGQAFSPDGIAGLENAFLRGYFEEHAIPLAMIRLFEIQWVLAKWPWGKQNDQGRKIIRRWQLAAKDRFLYQHLKKLLFELDEVRG